ncbi:hypothetical protein FJU30_15395 [Affinibrenneria salicis]|uniref:Uncharacterized protein n=1 Tax=Affinibrenneria salicis TaxID=2590031 RepID=A0A5J5FY62_9GAMM|nr:hypothetical protein [Affinibrenneria salicis]KAA8999054.1 hypothetical protein FJU30_15395 [Affinibrenneria salicis]
MWQYPFASVFLMDEICHILRRQAMVRQLKNDFYPIYAQSHAARGRPYGIVNVYQYPKKNKLLAIFIHRYSQGE